MPGNKVITKKKLQSRKSAVNGSKLHPNSRRAAQLQRVELREKKLELKGRVRRSTEVSKIDRHVHFVHSIPAESTSLSLTELHEILQAYIARNDDEVAALKQEREGRSWRKAEGKSKRETELEGIKEREESEYRSGFVVPDLTLAENVQFCRLWINPVPASADKKSSGGDPSFFPRIRLIRIFSGDKNQVVVEREGARAGEWETGQGEVDMADEDEEEP